MELIHREGQDLYNLDGRGSVFEDLNRLEGLLVNIGVPVKGYTVQSESVFFSQTPQIRDSVSARVAQYLELIEEIFENFETLTRESVWDEKKCLDIAFRNFGMWPRRGEDFGFIEQGWIVEIYNMEMKQIYRNFEFMRQCSYDLLTLETIDWAELYKRPEHIIEKMWSLLPTLMGTDHTFPYVDVPPHLIRERYLHHDRVFVNKHKYITPLFDASGSKCGFVNFVESTPMPSDSGSFVKLI